MGRPAKAVDVMTESGSSHLTKGEIRARKDAEKASLSGVKLQERAEVKLNPIAHAEFVRVTKLLNRVGRRDALFEPIINRYCMIQAECAAFEQLRAGFESDLATLREDTELDGAEKCRLKAKIKFKGLGTEGYVEITKVQACRRDADDSWWRGRRVWLGLDLSQTDDNTAVAMVAVEDGRIYARVWGFIPADRKLLKTKREGVNYDRMISSGACFACGGEVIDYGAVERHIVGLEEKYGVKIVQVGYDRYNAISTVQKLEEHALECVEIKQHSSVLHSPTKLLREQILSGAFRYDANQLLEINMQNARCTKDTNMNLYVNKKRSAGKVDMVVALINAVYLAQQEMLYGSGFVAQVL